MYLLVSHGRLFYPTKLKNKFQRGGNALTGGPNCAIKPVIRGKLILSFGQSPNVMMTSWLSTMCPLLSSAAPSSAF